MIRYLIIGLVSSLVTYHITNLIKDNEILSIKLTNEDIKYKTLQSVLSNNNQLIQTKDKAISYGSIKQKELQVTNDKLRNSVISLFNELQDTRTNINNNSFTPSIDYTLTINTLFGECIRAYSDMAEKAQGHALDVEVMGKAWPTLNN